MAQAPAEAPNRTASERGRKMVAARAAAHGGFWALVLGSDWCRLWRHRHQPALRFRIFHHVLQDGTLATPEEVLGIISLISGR